MDTVQSAHEGHVVHKTSAFLEDYCTIMAPVSLLMISTQELSLWFLLYSVACNLLGDSNTL